MERINKTNLTFLRFALLLCFRIINNEKKKKREKELEKKEEIITAEKN